MNKASIDLRVCCECYDIEEEGSMYRCAKCGKFMCAECNCSCAAPQKEPAGEIGEEVGSIAGRVGKAITRLFSQGRRVSF
jgi:hypothetical protein